MEKFFSDLIDIPIIASKESAIIGFLKDIIINPMNGVVVGIALDNKLARVIPAIDIRAIGKPIVISGVDAISEPDEIIKIHTALETGAKVLNNKVFTKSGDYLGRVYDYAINPTLLVLTKIAVEKNFLWFFKYNQILLPYTEIIEITPEKIIVRGSTAPKKSRAVLRTEQKVPACTGCETE